MWPRLYESRRFASLLPWVVMPTALITDPDIANRKLLSRRFPSTHLDGRTFVVDYRASVATVVVVRSAWQPKRDPRIT